MFTNKNLCVYNAKHKRLAESDSINFFNTLKVIKSNWATLQANNRIIDRRSSKYFHVRFQNRHTTATTTTLNQKHQPKFSTPDISGIERHKTTGPFAKKSTKLTLFPSTKRGATTTRTSSERDCCCGRMVAVGCGARAAAAARECGPLFRGRGIAHPPTHPLAAAAAIAMAVAVVVILASVVDDSATDGERD